MKKLKILIISRTIFPILSPRAFRTTELAKELALKGHNVTVFAILGNYNYSNFEEKTGIKIRNFGNTLFSTINSDGGFRYNLIDKILYHIFNRLIEFPDIELMFRIPNIIKKEKNIDLLITIAEPHQIHWGGALAKAFMRKNEFPTIWISDCGDPYIGNSFDKKKYFYFKYIEKWWCRNTDFITIPLKEAKSGYYNEFHQKIVVIPQGFDLSNVQIDNSFIKNVIPTFSYAGSVYPGKRDPKMLFDFLLNIEKKFIFIVYTNSPNYYDPYKLLLKNKLEIRPYISHDKLIYELSKMDFLINLKNPNSIQLPSKIIDYLLTKRPILEVSLNFTQIEKDSFLEFLAGNYNNSYKEIDIEQYNINNIAQKFVNLYLEDKN